MMRLKEEDMANVESVVLNEVRYYSVKDTAEKINEDLSGVETVSILDRPFATLEKINAGRKREELSDFNKTLLRAKNFKK